MPAHQSPLTASAVQVLATFLAGFLSVFVASVACGQERFTDPRDGRVYQVAEIGELTWFTSNLNYLTPTSWCSEVPDSDACRQGNFYYYTDLDSVCPPGWRVPNWEDYAALFEFIADTGKDSVRWNYGLLTGDGYTTVATFILGLDLVNSSPPLNLVATGWVQGNKWFGEKKVSAANLWMATENVDEKPQPHLHVNFDDYSIVRHSHAHHVLDKPRKQRRFSVRCISGRN